MDADVSFVSAPASETRASTRRVPHVHFGGSGRFFVVASGSGAVQVVPWSRLNSIAAPPSKPVASRLRWRVGSPLDAAPPSMLRLSPLGARTATDGAENDVAGPGLP